MKLSARVPPRQVVARHFLKNSGLIRRATNLVGVALVAFFIIDVCPLSPVPKVKAIGGNPSLGLVISQVYGGAGCGTAGCSTYQNDYIELYNRAKSAVTCTGCSVQYTASMGTAWQVTPLPATLTLQPGQYYLIAESFGANGINPLPTPDTTGTIAMSATAAKVALVNSTTALSGACPSAVTGTPAIIDFVGYGATANCSETANAPAPSTTTSDQRAGGGNIETDNNSTDFSALAPTPRNTSSAPATPTASNGVVSGEMVNGDGAPISGAVVLLSGTQVRKTITSANGNYRFENVDTGGFYTVTPERSNYRFSPASRSFSQLGNITEAAFTGTAPFDYDNPLDAPEYFVRQQYLDVLGREPDEAGFNYWSDQILSCGADVSCVNTRRTTVAAAFFVENEFKQSGAFIYNLYKSALGRAPVYSEYSALRGEVVGGAALEAQKRAFAVAFVSRTDFVSSYESSTNAESFVDALLANVRVSGIDLSSQREGLIGRYHTGASQAESRSLVLREVSESEAVRAGNYNSAFVLLEYFGYLHRDPDQNGYDFWLTVLNQSAPGTNPANYYGMVCSFITATEYQRQFGQRVIHGNAECAQ